MSEIFILTDSAAEHAKYAKSTLPGLTAKKRIKQHHTYTGGHHHAKNNYTCHHRNYSARNTIGNVHSRHRSMGVRLT